MVDRSIDRLLEYAPMPRACVGLAAAICSASLLTACAGKSFTKAEPAPKATSAPAPARPQPQSAQPQSPSPQAQAAPPRPATPAPKPQVAPDPVADLIALSNRHFEAAQRELQAGHQAGARTEFNRAVEVVVYSPLGARSAC